MAKKTKSKPLYKCEWRDVVALNFNVDPRLLLPLIPKGTRVLTYHDHALITIMAKNIREYRPYAKNLTLFRSVDEIDIRVYLTWDNGNEVRNGHYKLKNLVSNKMACRIFRFLSGQEQELVSISRSTTGFEDATLDALPTAEYRWSHEDSDNLFRVTARNQAGKGADGSKEQFVLQQEHRFVSSSRGTQCLPIRQTPWLVWNASSGSFDCNTHLFLGKEFRKYFARPSFVLLSRGGEVTVSKGVKVN